MLPGDESACLPADAWPRCAALADDTTAGQHAFLYAWSYQCLDGEPAGRSLPMSTHAAFLQFQRPALQRNAATLMAHPSSKCCADCMRVQQRCAASCEARAQPWFTAWEYITCRCLEPLEQGHPHPPLILPHLDLRLPEGLPEELPPSIDRCSACQKMLDQVRLSRLLAAQRESRL